MMINMSTILILSLFAQTTAGTEDSDTALSGSSDIGITLISGNSESANSAANFDFSFMQSVHKFDFGLHYQGVRDTDQSTGTSSTSSRLYRSDIQYNYYLSEDEETYFWTNIASRQDEPNGLVSRNNFGAGMGYHFSFDNELNFSVEAGVTYVDEEKVSADSEATVARMAFDFKWPISKDLSILTSSEFLSGDDVETFVQDFSLRYSLNNDWYLQLANNTAYDAFPSDGSVTTDSRWNMTLGTSF